MLGAFFVWITLARRQLKEGLPLLTFLACWSASIPLIYYAAELKQYSMDVFSAALFLIFCARQQELAKNKNFYRILLLTLPLLGLCSYTAFLFFIFPFFNLLREPQQRPTAGAYAVMACAVAAFVYFFDLRVSNAVFLQRDWHDYFISFDSIGEFFKTFGEGVNNLLSRWFAETPKWVRMAARFFMALGLIQLLAGFWPRLKNDQWKFFSVETIGFIVFWELVGLGVLHKYPFTVPRTSLFFCPILFFTTARALENLKSGQKYLYWPVQMVFIVYLVVVSIGIAGDIFAGDLGAQSIIWVRH